MTCGLTSHPKSQCGGLVHSQPVLSAVHSCPTSACQPSFVQHQQCHSTTPAKQQYRLSILDMSPFFLSFDSCDKLVPGTKKATSRIGAGREAD